MSNRQVVCANNDDLQAYSADITVTFAGSEPFTGSVYIQGDGNHAVFCWPAQTNTRATTELAQFKTQTKWVTSEGVCTQSKFSDPDPKFVGMVSHGGYERVSSDQGTNVYSMDGITCTYVLDEDGREMIASIVFQGVKIEFRNVVVAPQDPSRFVPPSDCGAADRASA